jgi:hypothetical protein
MPPRKRAADELPRPNDTTKIIEAMRKGGGGGQLHIKVRGKEYKLVVKPSPRRQRARAIVSSLLRWGIISIAVGVAAGLLALLLLIPSLPLRLFIGVGGAVAMLFFAHFPGRFSRMMIAMLCLALVAQVPGSLKLTILADTIFGQFLAWFEANADWSFNLAIVAIIVVLVRNDPYFRSGRR